MLNTLGLVPALETQTKYTRTLLHPRPHPLTMSIPETKQIELEGKGDALDTDPGTPLGAEILTPLTLMLGKSL